MDIMRPDNIAVVVLILIAVFGGQIFAYKSAVGKFTLKDVFIGIFVAFIFPVALILGALGLACWLIDLAGKVTIIKKN